MYVQTKPKESHCRKRKISFAFNKSVKHFYKIIREIIRIHTVTTTKQKSPQNKNFQKLEFYIFDGFI